MFNKIRRLLYKLTRRLGDLNALFKGRIGSRLFNKLLGRNFIRKLWSRGGCGCVMPLLVGAAGVIICMVL